VIGLLIKDLYALKKQWRVVFLITIIYLVFSISSENMSMFSTISIVYAIILPMSAMAYDEHCKWDKYALSLPLSRTTIVLSKYVLGIMLNLAAGILVSGVNVAFSYYWGQDIGEAIATALGISGAGLIMLAVMLPVLFKFGVEKARLIMIVIFLVPTLLVLLVPGVEFDLSPQLLSALPYLLPVAIVAVVLLSMLISVKIYTRKEF
jgi:ABC-2 type transport system permease protein